MKSIHPPRILGPLLAAVPFIAAPLLLSGCSGTGGVSWGEQAGGGGAAMANGAAAASGQTVRTGSISSPLINGTSFVIARREATPRQRAIAVTRARHWMKRKPSVGASGHHHRYIAVQTAPDSHTSPGAQTSVMIFDTDARQVVGKNVYDVQSPPPVGAMARFETYSAEYIGPGL